MNIQKHSVSFQEAQNAFMDQNRIIIKDSKHSEVEERFFLYWKDRKWYSNPFGSQCEIILLGLLEQDIGEKEKIDMKKKTIYTNTPDDFSEAISSGRKSLRFSSTARSAY